MKTGLLSILSSHRSTVLEPHPSFPFLHLIPSFLSFPFLSSPKTSNWLLLNPIAVVREVLVELEPPDNIAAAKIEVDSASTRVVQATIFPPLGVSFEEDASTREIVVMEVLPGSNAEKVGGIAIGDILRACSAMVPEMKYPQGNLLLGGVGRPGFRRVLFMAWRWFYV